MADRGLLPRAFAVVSSARRFALLLAATVDLAREMEAGSRPTGLTLSTTTRRNETMVYWLDLSHRPVQRMVEVYGAEGPTLWDLGMPDTAEGAQDV